MCLLFSEVPFNSPIFSADYVFRIGFTIFALFLEHVAGIKFIKHLDVRPVILHTQSRVWKIHVRAFQQEVFWKNNRIQSRFISHVYKLLK